MKLAATVRESIIDHARDTSPNEACGLLGGHAGDTPTILRSVPTPNVASNPTIRFEIDPEALLAGRDQLSRDGHDLLGFYHSHPKGPAGPSETDREAARWPETYTVIVSLGDAQPTVGAWFDTGDSFRPEPLEPEARRG